MGEKMTLDDALSKAQPYTVMHGKSGQYPDGTGWGHAWNEDGVWLPREAWAVIRAHLTQPAQAVDGWSIPEWVTAALDVIDTETQRLYLNPMDGNKIGLDERSAVTFLKRLIADPTGTCQMYAPITAALPKDSNGAEGVGS